jgi:hypothetical protein
MCSHNLSLYTLRQHLVPSVRVNMPRFLHIPKCGGSLDQTLFAYTNGSMVGSDRHAPLTNEEDASLVAAVFRHPEERLRSAYWHLREKKDFCCKCNEFGYSPKERKAIMGGIARNEPIKRVVGAYTGCQTKMVLGHRCFSRPAWDAATTQVAARAAARISRFFFVGLTSEWRLSVCLLNYRLTGHRFVTAFQLKNCRPAQIKPGAALNMSADELNAFNMLPIDELDHATYLHAQERFWRDAGRAGVSDSTCPLMATPNFGCASWWRLACYMRNDTARILGCLPGAGRAARGAVEYLHSADSTRGKVGVPEGGPRALSRRSERSLPF